MNKLSALDASFLELEDAHVAVHIGGTAVFDNPAPETAELISRLEHLIATHPHYRQVISRTPFDLRRPEWRDAGRLDLDYHVRRTALTAPGTRAQLGDLVGLIMSTPLNPKRPMWKAWLVEGLADEKWAIVLKMHHSMVDGVAGMATMLDLLDPIEDGGSLAALPVAAAPTALRGLAGQGWQQLVHAARHPFAMPASIARSLATVPKALAVLRPAAPSSLNGQLGGARSYTTLTVEQADIRAVREVLGGTMNDVVLTMVARGFHELLPAHGDKLRRRAVRCLVPMNLRTPAELHTEANKVTVALVDLPIEFHDARDAFPVLRAHIDDVKRSSTASTVGGAFVLANLVPSAIASAALGLYKRLPQRIVTTIATNVPGPKESRTLLGRRMVALYPYVPIADRIRIAVAVTSYADRLHFGVTSDRKAFRDTEVFVDGMAAALYELMKSVPRPAAT